METSNFETQPQKEAELRFPFNNLPEKIPDYFETTIPLQGIGEATVSYEPANNEAQESIDPPKKVVIKATVNLKKDFKPEEREHLGHSLDIIFKSPFLDFLGLPKISDDGQILTFNKFCPSDVAGHNKEGSWKPLETHTDHLKTMGFYYKINQAPLI